MKKVEFLNELRSSLKQFKEDEVKEIISYYDEMINDRLEEGKTEETVIESLGSIKLISARIQSDLMNVRLSQPDNKNIVKSSNNFFIVLMLCASPALIPLGIAFFAVFISLFITFGALIFSFGVTAIALIVAAIPATIIAVSNIGIGSGLLVFGVMLILTGVFALLTVAMISAGGEMLNFIIKQTNKIINKNKKR